MEQQLGNISAFCQRNNYTIVEKFEDCMSGVALKGTETKQRKGLDAAFNYMIERKCRENTWIDCF